MWASRAVPQDRTHPARKCPLASLECHKGAIGRPAAAEMEGGRKHAAKGRLGQLSAINRHNQQLFDLLVGAQQDRRGYGMTERLGGLEVHSHLEFRRLEHW